MIVGQGPRFASIEEVQSLTQRVASQDQRLDEILRILRAQITATPAPSSSTIPTVQERSAPTVHATPAALVVPTPSIIAEIVPVQTETVLPAPPAQTETTPTTPVEMSTGATVEARQSREFQRHRPAEFYGGTNLEAAEKFMKSHEKIHDILATPEYMRSSISSGLMFGEADAWWRTMVATKGKPKDWAEFKRRFNQKYFPPSVLKQKRAAFLSIRRYTEESVMQYMGRYLQLLDYAGGVADTDADQAHYFMEGLLRDIGGTVVTTEPETLQAAYERSLAREAYLRTHPGEIIRAPATAQLDHRAGGDRGRKRHRLSRARNDRAQSTGSVAPPVHPTRTASVSSVSVRSYADTTSQEAKTRRAATTISTN
ncbi:hypothetical protein Scep_001079 [Stephania cephalantha]|uniref:Retrotransposon gag domain-containing protein n=1 Tax=Stephania cephalantha TaxID=152367 RepID=A0AAP0L8P4_9MAGN